MKKTLLILLIFTSVAKADPFSDIWKWVSTEADMVSPNADENSAMVSAPTVPTLSPTAVSPTPTAVSMPSPEYLEHVAMNKNMASEITKLLTTPLN
jgi:hypothetical protein